MKHVKINANTIQGNTGMSKEIPVMLVEQSGETTNTLLEIM